MLAVGKSGTFKEHENVQRRGVRCDIGRLSTWRALQAALAARHRTVVSGWTLVARLCSGAALDVPRRTVAAPRRTCGCLESTGGTRLARRLPLRVLKLSWRAFAARKRQNIPRAE